MSYESKINLGNDEEIIQVANTSFLAWIGSFVLVFILFFVSAYFFYYLLSLQVYGEIILGAVFLLIIFILLRVFILQAGNALVVTTKRVVDIDRPGLFTQNIYTLNYSEIKDVAIVSHGFMSFLFKTGDVIVESKQGEYSLDLTCVSHPQSVQTLILSERQEYKMNKKLENNERVYETFTDRLEEFSDNELVDMRDLINHELKKRSSSHEK